MSAASRRDAWSLVGLALVLALLLGLGRAAVVAAMDGWGRGHDWASVLWRVEARLVTAQALALPVGLAMALLLTRAKPWRLLGVLVAALLACLYWSGFGYDDAFHVPDPATQRGRLGLAGLGAVALVFAAAGRGLAAVLPVGRRVLFLGVVALVAGPLGFERLLQTTLGSGERMLIRQVVLDWTTRPDLWSEASADARADSISPLLDYKYDGGDRAALCLPLPGRVTLTVPELKEAGSYHFVAAAGGHHESGKRRPFEVRYTVTRQDELVFKAQQRYGRDIPADQRVWQHVGGREGLPVEAGDRLVLQTELIDGRPTPADRVGFGGCRLVRSREADRARSSPEAPNILVVVMDTLRFDRTSLQHPPTPELPHPSTPVLEALARRGISYTQAQSTSSWTWPSTASILTGLTPPAHGVSSATACTLAQEIQSLPELLQQRGYTTGAFSANPLISSEREFDQGFEHFQSARQKFMRSSVLVPDVVAWIERQAGRRFFAYVQLTDPHEPHRPRPEFLERYTSGRPGDLPKGALTHYADQVLRIVDDQERSQAVPPTHREWLHDVYNACVASGDHWFAEILAALDSSGILDETIVVFTSDHGEEFFDHSYLKHGHNLHREQLHVPLVLVGPGLPAGVVVDTPVSNRHIAPTLARLGGTAFDAQPGAVDLAEPLTVQPQPLFASTHIGWHAGQSRQTLLAWREGHEVVQGVLGEDGNLTVTGDYDLSTDPFEQRPGALGAIRAEALLRKAKDFREAQAQRAPTARAGGASTTEMLRGIGYLGDDQEQ